MKKLLLASLILTSMSSFAATADSTALKNLRARFENAEAASNKYFTSHSFKCKEFNIVDNDVSESSNLNPLNFIEYDSYLYSEQKGSDMNDLLYRTREKDNSIVATNELTNGDVIEVAFKQEAAGTIISARSTYFAKNQVVSYSVCTIK